MENPFDDAAKSADVLDSTQNDTLSAQPDEDATPASVLTQNNTLSAQLDAGAKSAAALKTAPLTVAQPTDPLYTAPRIFQAPAAQELGP